MLSTIRRDSRSLSRQRVRGALPLVDVGQQHTPAKDLAARIA
jgi:hypothetical protein